MSKLKIVGKYNTAYNAILNIDLPEMEIICSRGLITHLYKRNHFRAIKYVESIPEIIENPDYIGSGSGGPTSIKYVKQLEDDVLLVAKINEDRTGMFVATMFVIDPEKLKRYVYKGNLKKCIDKESGNIYNTNTEMRFNEPEP